MSNEKINKSFLNILSPHSFNKEFGNHQLLNVPINIYQIILRYIIIININLKEFEEF